MRLKNATIYIADPSLISSKFFNQFESIKKITTLYEDEKASGMILDLEFATIQANFMPAEEIEKHLQGFENYVKSIFNGSNDDLVYVLARLRSIRLPIGMVIETNSEDELEVINFLYDFNCNLNGLLFLYDSVFDYDGSTLVEPLAEIE